MDNYFPADFHALRDQHLADWRDGSNRQPAQYGEFAEHEFALERSLCVSRSVLRDRTSNDCIDPGWRSL
jgi:hypothetical protein